MQQEINELKQKNYDLKDQQKQREREKFNFNEEILNNQETNGSNTFQHRSKNFELQQRPESFEERAKERIAEKDKSPFGSPFNSLSPSSFTKRSSLNLNLRKAILQRKIYPEFKSMESLFNSQNFQRLYATIIYEQEFVDLCYFILKYFKNRHLKETINYSNASIFIFDFNLQDLVEKANKSKENKLLFNRQTNIEILGFVESQVICNKYALIYSASNASKSFTNFINLNQLSSGIRK